MRRRYVSDEELDQVMKLKLAGASWLKIQAKTGVPRRSAKRAYEDWERNKSIEELKRARVQVATEAFRDHVDYIISLTEVLINHLSQSMMFYETRDAEKALSDIFMRDIPEQSTPTIPFRSKPEKEQQRIARQNEMIFQSLKNHTHEKVQWQVLEKWKQDWNTCRDTLAELRAESREVVMNILNDQEPNIRDRVKKSGMEKDVIKDMITGVVEAVWRGILAGKPEEGYNLIRTKAAAEGTAQVLFGEPASLTAVELADSDVVEEAARVCKQAAQNLCRGDLVQQANNMIHRIEARIKELEVMLNPLILRPLILRTRCELCPA